MSATAQSQESAQSVLEAKPPTFSASEAEQISLAAYHIQASAHPLDSERDQNFRLHASNGREWVLKIANLAENPPLLEMQTQALLHIAKADPTLPILLL